MNDAMEKLKDLIMKIFDMRLSTAEKCIVILDNIKAIIENEETKRVKAKSDAMQFPETWGEFEANYGFTDREEVYTNGARLIPSFRVEQWLEHIDQVKHGRWVSKNGWVNCSVCGLEPPNESNEISDFCPNCGARMDM